MISLFDFTLKVTNMLYSTVLWLSTFLILTKCDDLKPYELNDFLQNTYINRIWNATWISGKVPHFKKKKLINFTNFRLKLKIYIL